MKQYTSIDAAAVIAAKATQAIIDNLAESDFASLCGTITIVQLQDYRYDIAGDIAAAIVEHKLDEAEHFAVNEACDALVAELKGQS